MPSQAVAGVSSPVWSRTEGRTKLRLTSDRVRLGAYVLPACLLLGLFVVWPLIWVVAISFTTWDGLGPIHFVGLTTWQTLFADTTFQAAVRNTLIWIALSATLPVLGGFVLALLFAKAGRVGLFGRMATILPLLIPLAATAVIWRVIYDPNIGALNRFLGLFGLSGPDWLGDSRFAFWSLFAIILWASLGFSALIFGAALASIDRSYYDLARVEGAGSLSMLRLVIVPACRKTAALAMIVTVVLTSSVFDLLYVVTTSANNTIMLPMDMTNRAFSISVSQGAGESTVELVIGLLLAGLVLWLSGSHAGMSGDGEREIRPNRLAAVLTAVVGVVMLMPLLSALSTATTSGAEALINPSEFPWPPDFSSFSGAWNGGIGSGMGESLLFGIAVVAVTVVLSLPAAYAMAWDRFPSTYRRIVLGILVIALLLPGEPYLLPVYYLVQQLQVGPVAGLIMAEAARELPFGILLLWLFMSSLPSDVLAAAELEAGRGVRMLTLVVVPLVAPIAVAVALWTFVTSWSESTLPSLLLVNSVQTAPMALKTFAGTTDTQVNLLSAGALLFVAPIVVAFLAGSVPAGRGMRLALRSLAR